MHSTASDGHLTPSQLIEKIASIGLKAAALTDHDVVDGCTEFKQVASQHGIIAVNGSELSAKFPSVSMEILAIDIPDSSIPYFKEHQKIMIEERFRVAQERLNLLNKLGINISWKDIAYDDKGNLRTQIGKPHIVSAMLKAGYIKDWDEGFDKYLNKGRPAYVVKHEPAAKEIISFILDNGAVPILAHPIHTKRQGKDLIEVLKTLQSFGLMGIEVFHSDHPSSLRHDYLQMIENLKLMTSGGSDFHGGAHPGVNIGVGKGDLRIPYMVLETIFDRKIKTSSYYDELRKYA